jgi:hypothetical protein
MYYINPTKVKSQGNNMRTIESLLAPHKSIYAAYKALGIRQGSQFKRHLDMGAIIDDDGQPWIKSGKPVEGWKV